MKLGEGVPLTEFTVFLSSANELWDLRQRVDGLFHKVVEPFLKRISADVRFHLDNWSTSEPRRFEEDETIDDEFVTRVEASNLLFVLVVEELGSGYPQGD